MAEVLRRRCRRAGRHPRSAGIRRDWSTAITALYAEEGYDLAEIARHVGHANPTNTGLVPPSVPPASFSTPTWPTEARGVARSAVELHHG